MSKKLEDIRCICKFQRPIFSGIGEDVYVYNKDRTIDQHLPMSPEFREMFGESYKVYYWCELRGEDFYILEKATYEEAGF